MYKDDNPEAIYTIKAKPIDNTSSGNTDVLISAKPLDLKNITVPTKGEIVWLVKGATPQSDSSYKIKEYYYSNAVNLQNSINHNALPTIHEYKSTKKSSKDYKSSSSGISNSSSSDTKSELGSTIKEKNINPLQIYEGDNIFQSRWGSSIRLGGNNDGDSPYSVSQPWKGDTNNPIIIISNGHGNTAGSNKLIAEEANKDASSIYLTKQSKLEKFKPSNNNYGQGVTNGTKYEDAQILVTSDRLTLNSKKDYIILDGKKSVNIATPNWATDMDKYFTLLDDIFTELKNLHTEVTNINTELTKTNIQQNVVSTGLITFGSAQATATAAVPLFVPLGAAPGALGGIAGGTITPISGIAASVGTITGKLTGIKTKLGTLTTRYDNLKQ